MDRRTTVLNIIAMCCRPTAATGRDEMRKGFVGSLDTLTTLTLRKDRKTIRTESTILLRENRGGGGLRKLKRPTQNRSRAHLRGIKCVTFSISIRTYFSIVF